MGNLITCVRIGVHGSNLTHGQQYEVVEENTERRQVRIRSNRGRLRWFPRLCFDLIPPLVSWQFDEKIEDEVEQEWAPNVSFLLSDGRRRWSILATPQFLTMMFEPPMPHPGFWASNLIVVRSYAPEVVDQALRHLDEEGELINASELIEPVEEDQTQGSSSVSAGD